MTKNVEKGQLIKQFNDQSLGPQILISNINTRLNIAGYCWKLPIHAWSSALRGKQSSWQDWAIASQYHAEFTVKLGHAILVIVKLVLQPEKGELWLELNEYPINALFSMTFKLTLGQVEEWLSLGEDELRSQIMPDPEIAIKMARIKIAEDSPAREQQTQLG